MAAKKIEGIEAEMLQFRTELEEQKHESSRRHEESTKRFQELGSQMEAMMTLLSTVSAAIDPALIGETGGISTGRFGTESSGGGRREEETNHRDRGGDRTEFRIHKVKMPVFDGDDVYGWIYRAERYFEVQQIRREELVTTAALCMEGAALTWYRWSHGRVPFRSWEELKGRLLDRFQSAHGGDLYEQFLAITQIGTAREYASMFERMAGQLLNLPEPVLEGAFMKGLKPELRTMLRIMQPDGLTQMMRLAITLEDNQGPEKVTGVGGGFVRFGTGSPTAGRGGAPASTRTAVPSSLGEKKDISSSPARPGQFKRLSGAEMADRRAKGLCFRCDERFTPGHRCTG